MVEKVTEALSGRDLFDAELFFKGDEVYFSAVSSKLYDSDIVALISQKLSEFELYAGAILGLPIPTIHFNRHRVWSSSKGSLKNYSSTI
ncbi:hypothetical protein [Pseudoalteromonas arctica]|uniref:Uncharacterized protein n=1 Tax=Pseudoalteromonas arctica TaxID=394751 RepID=A0A7Y0HDD9_9GAMM|nr:hypothetical protein [Pseudoalteromonas arctica]